MPQRKGTPSARPRARFETVSRRVLTRPSSRRLNWSTASDRLIRSQSPSTLRGLLDLTVFRETLEAPTKVLGQWRWTRGARYWGLAYREIGPVPATKNFRGTAFQWRRCVRPCTSTAPWPPMRGASCRLLGQEDRNHYSKSPRSTFSSIWRERSVFSSSAKIPSTNSTKSFSNTGLAHGLLSQIVRTPGLR